MQSFKSLKSVLEAICQIEVRKLQGRMSDMSEFFLFYKKLKKKFLKRLVSGKKYAHINIMN